MKYSLASKRQIIASSPEASTWLSANAGSGKTKVLTDRVARLLLDNVSPQRILCLTYTKAAANEMQNRLFARLGKWSMMSDIRLTENLQLLGLSQSKITKEKLSIARRLFAQAIETPGGLKIQTIHSFCSSLLRRFSLEAQVSPSFSEMDDRMGKNLRSEVLEEMAENNTALLKQFISYFSGQNIDDILKEIIKYKEYFINVSDLKRVKKDFNIPEQIEELSDTVNILFQDGEYEWLHDSINILMEQSQSMRDLAKRLSRIDFKKPQLADVDLIFDCFLFRKDGLHLPDAKHKSVPTAKAKIALGDRLLQFQNFMTLAANTRDMQLKILGFKKTSALHNFSKLFIDKIETRKALKSWLDFDDLIIKTIALLKNSSFASYILYLLDGGIDHILIDEAQDNSPKQWEVIRLLAEDFTSGKSARNNTCRTIFAVGDKKQSIYSFQGADPTSFDRMRNHFQNSMHLIGQELQPLSLLHSFRSSKPILELVDATFPISFLDTTDCEPSHIAFKEHLPGRVDLWDWIETNKDSYDTKWYDPIDTIGNEHHNVLLANKIANKIQEQILNGTISQTVDHGTSAENSVRNIKPGDFLILVQTRSTLFYELIRSCKKLNLPIAGADRLDITADLAVKDLISVLSFLTTPEDDLALAEVLRSPLCGLTENDLFNLANDRKGLYLYETLRAKRDAFPNVYEMLYDLRDQVDYLRPYELLERIFTRHNGRRNLIARLGLEVEDILDVFLDQAIAYEKTEVPSITGFVSWVSDNSSTIKRQFDSGTNKIRIMTIHGAKGLEAPIVILPDTGPIRNIISDELIINNDYPIWRQKSAEMPTTHKELIDKIKNHQISEKMRLLYVSITRAESWLIICGSGTLPQPEKPCWYQLIESGLSKLNSELNTTDTGQRVSFLDWPDEVKREEPSQQNIELEVPKWLKTPAPADLKFQNAITPSALELNKLLETSNSYHSTHQQLTRGTALHLLLEHLPAEPKVSRNDRARQLLSTLDSITVEELISKVEKILCNPDFSYIFDKNSFSEISLSAKLETLNGQKVIGKIDRLIVNENRILAVDFKSNVVVPKNLNEVPIALIAQMGAYQESLRAIFPNKEIQTAILWTENEFLQELDPTIVKEAFNNASMT